MGRCPSLHLRKACSPFLRSSGGGGVGEEGSWQQEVRRKAKSVREGVKEKKKKQPLGTRVSSSVPGSTQTGAGGENMVVERGGGG